MTRKPRFLRPGGSRSPGRRSYGSSGEDRASDRSEIRRSFSAAYEVVRRQKWLILVVFVGVVAAAVVYVATKPPEYRAQSILLINEQAYDPSNALTYGRITGLDNPGVTMQLDVLKQSRSVAERAAARLSGLEAIPGTDRPFTFAPDTLPESAIARRLQQSVIEIGEAGANLISVRATSLDPDESAFLANLFAEEAVAHSQEISRGRVSSSREFLEEQLREERSALETAEHEMQQYLRQEGAVALDQEAQAAIANVARIEAALADARIEHEITSASIEATQAELTKIRPVLSQRVASGVDRELESGQERLTELELRLDQLYFLYPELRENPGSDPRVAALQTEIQQWRDRISSLSERYVGEVLAAGGMDLTNPESGVAYASSMERQLINDRITLTGLESKIAALEEQLNQYDTRLRTIPRQAARVAQLERSRASAEQFHSYLESRLQEALLAEEAETGSLQILRPAEPPFDPVSPRPERIIPLAAVLALLVGTGAATLRSKLDRRIYTPTDVQESGFHLLGVVPDMRQLIKKQFGRAKTADYMGSSVATTMVALLNPGSAIAESYRRLFTRLLPYGKLKDPRTIIVTSPDASVGKSTTALNLALSSAAARRRTLIIDVDLRKPAAEKYLGLPRGLTLHDVMNMAPEPGIGSVIAKGSATKIPNLHVITVGEPMGNPLEHLMSRRLHSLIELLKKEFDVIVFDSPPLLLTPDAALLAPLCDATIVVAAAGQTDASALSQIEDELDEMGASMTGVVLNKFDPTNRNFKATYGYLQNNYGSYFAAAAN